MDDLKREGRGWKKLKASKTRRLKTEEWIDVPWRDDWNSRASPALGYGGESLTWTFCFHTDSSRTNWALKHLQLEQPILGSTCQAQIPVLPFEVDFVAFLAAIKEQIMYQEVVTIGLMLEGATPNCMLQISVCG